MPHIKKIVTMFLVSALLGGGIWYLSTTGGVSSISSSVLNASAFSCTEASLKSQASLYRTTVTRHKKAVPMKKNLEKEIALLKKSDPKNQLQKKEETLKLLVKQINTYYRFIKKYETCKKEIKLNPAVSSGVMSGEAKIAVSEKEYQALAAFKISSPNGLNTYVQSIQFKIDILPSVGIVADKWFLLHEGAGPIACQMSANTQLINCELSGDMPVSIMSGTSRTYGIGAHITTLQGSGTVDIQIAKISFNESRTYSDTQIRSPLLSFGIVAPVVEEVGVSTDETIDETPAQTVTTPTTTTETTETTETSTSAESTIPASSGTPSVETPVVQTGVTDETPVQTVTTPPVSSETTTTITTPEVVSNPVVPTPQESTTPASSETTTEITPEEQTVETSPTVTSETF